MCSSKSNTGSQKQPRQGLQTELQPRGCREQQEGGGFRGEDARKEGSQQKEGRD